MCRLSSLIENKSSALSRQCLLTSHAYPREREPRERGQQHSIAHTKHTYKHRKTYIRTVRIQQKLIYWSPAANISITPPSRTPQYSPGATCPTPPSFPPPVSPELARPPPPPPSTAPDAAPPPLGRENLPPFSAARARSSLATLVLQVTQAFRTWSRGSGSGRSCRVQAWEGRVALELAPTTTAARDGGGGEGG